MLILCPFTVLISPCDGLHSVIISSSPCILNAASFVYSNHFFFMCLLFEKALRTFPLLKRSCILFWVYYNFMEPHFTQDRKAITHNTQISIIIQYRTCLYLYGIFVLKWTIFLYVSTSNYYWLLVL